MRRPDWESRLTEYLASVREKPHDYGSHDCLLFCAGAVNAQTGKDFARGHRRKYRDEEGAKEYLASLGFKTPAAMVDFVLPRKRKGFAQTGDIVLCVDDEGKPVPGVCLGDFAVIVTGEGLGRVSEWRRAWAV